MTKASSLSASLPPLSPVAQLLYDITSIIEAGVQMAGDTRRESVEALGRDAEMLGQDAVECSLDESTMTITVSASPHVRVS